MRYLITATIVAMLIGLTGCSDDKSSNPAGPGTTQNTAAIPQITFKGPNTTSTDPYAMWAKTSATTFNAILAPSTVFASLPAQQNGNTSTWTYTVGGATYTFTGIKQSDGSYVWTYVVNGTSGTTTYNNFKGLEGTSSADGKSGSWAFYELNQTTKVSDLAYTTNASNVLTGTWITYESNGTISSKMILVNNPDGSGSLEIYDDGLHMNYKSVWIANGSGTWYTYDSSGVQTETGTWI